jgi:hypothetical protein
VDILGMVVQAMVFGIRPMQVLLVPVVAVAEVETRLIQTMVAEAALVSMG